MHYTEGRMGRVFVLRLEDGERLNDTLEAFAREHSLAHALAFYLGGSASGSTVVVGPDTERPDAVVPLLHMLQGSQEVLALGTLVPDEAGDAGAPHARRRRPGRPGHRGLHPGRGGRLAGGRSGAAGNSRPRGQAAKGPPDRVSAPDGGAGEKITGTDL